MGFADGDLSRFRRSWTYHHAGHLDNPDPGWHYPLLMTVAGALGLGPFPALPLAAGFSPAPAPAVDDGWGERSRGYYGEQARHGRAEWREVDGWDGWYGRDAWGGRGWYQGQGSGYDTGSDDASKGSRRPRSPSRRPRRPRDSGPEEPHSDGRGGSRRRRLSSVGVGGRGSAFACNLRLGLLGGVTDVDGGCLVGLHDSRGYPRCAMVMRGVSGFAVTSRRLIRGDLSTAPGALSTGPPLLLGTVNCPVRAVGVAVSRLPGCRTCQRLMGPRCWRSPCRIGVSRPGPPSRFLGLSGKVSTARFLTRMSLMIALPMEE